MEELAPRELRGIRRRQKLCKDALQRHVDEYPDMLLRERAEHFGVGVNTVWTALKVIGVSKKNGAVSGKKPCIKV